MGVSNPAETVAGILTLIDQVQAKVEGSSLATVPWRPRSEEWLRFLARQSHGALERCEDYTDAVVVVTVAAVLAGLRENSDRTS